MPCQIFDSGPFKGISSFLGNGKTSLPVVQTLGSISPKISRMSVSVGYLLPIFEIWAMLALRSSYD
jgi:hypothetical protein